MQSPLFTLTRSNPRRRRVLTALAAMGILLGLLAPTWQAASGSAHSDTAVAVRPNPPICSGNGSGCGGGG